MKKIILLILLMLVYQTASAQCLTVYPGTVAVNSNATFLRGRNFIIAMSCAGRVPGLIYWRGGSMCVGRTFYGRTYYGRSFSCRVRAVRLWG